MLLIDVQFFVFPIKLRSIYVWRYVERNIYRPIWGTLTALSETRKIIGNLSHSNPEPLCQEAVLSALAVIEDEVSSPRSFLEGSVTDKTSLLTLYDPTSDLVRQYNFPVLLRCRKTSDTGFVAFVRPLSEPVRRFSSCSTEFSQQIAQVVLFLYLHVFLF
jgi:hypothetical protein